MARISNKCDFCNGNVGVQGCAHGGRLDPSQIAWRAACDHHDLIRPAHRPPKNSPRGGWLSVPEIVEQTEGLTQTLFEEALHVRRNVVTDPSDERWGMLDRGEITVGAVYDAARRASDGVNNVAGGKIAALEQTARLERDRRFTQDDLGAPYRAVFGTDFVDVATEVLPDGTNPMRADHILTAEDDGVIADWGPKTRPAWVNKPFSLRARFLARCLQEAADGRHVTYLETDDISTFVAQTALQHAHDIIACNGRPKYAKPNGEIDNNPTFGTILYGFGGEISSLLDHGLKGVALIPTSRVEAMLVAAIREIRKGGTDVEAVRAAHEVPAVPVPEAVIAILSGQNNESAGIAPIITEDA